MGEKGETLRQIERTGTRVCAAGNYEAERWATFQESLREQEAYLWGPFEAWADVEGGGSTVELERAHHHDRSGIRARTKQKSTGEEMGRVGSHLAMVSNLSNRWFVVNGLMGMNPWEVFEHQDWLTVKEGMSKLGQEGRRERVPVGKKRTQKVLGEAIEILSGEALGLWERLEGWAQAEDLMDTPSLP
jgi:hypothetical protein